MSDFLSIVINKVVYNPWNHTLVLFQLLICSLYFSEIDKLELIPWTFEFMPWTVELIIKAPFVEENEIHYVFPVIFRRIWDGKTLSSSHELTHAFSHNIIEVNII